MQNTFQDQLALSILRSDAAEAKAYNLRSATAVFVNQEMVPLDVAISREKMEAYLRAVAGRATKEG